MQPAPRGWRGAALNALTAWVLPAAALAAGAWGWGWRGVVLALTVIAFGLLLQFGRALRVLRDAAGRPKGSVASAVVLHARLHRGQRLPQVMRLAGSFGLPVPTAEAAAGGTGHAAPADEEVYRWRDAGGDAVRVRLRGGRVADWSLERAAGADAAGGAGTALP